MSISENIQTIRNQIQKASATSGRNASDINLVAVSKKQPIERIHEALNAGHRLFGENRAQEAQERWGGVVSMRSGHKPNQTQEENTIEENTITPPTSCSLCEIIERENKATQGKEAVSKIAKDLRLHLIGPLQTNKVKDAVALFDVIETVDREKLAKTLSKEMEKQNRHLPCFIQVNTGAEDQKAGIAIDDLEAFYDFCIKECGLNIIGLMCIPPIDEPPALHFALLKKYADQLGLKELSMGMSADFEKAIPLGATYIRVGTGVFGERPQ